MECKGGKITEKYGQYQKRVHMKKQWKIKASQNKTHTHKKKFKCSKLLSATGVLDPLYVEILSFPYYSDNLSSFDKKLSYYL